jgi:ribonuclease HIII
MHTGPSNSFTFALDPTQQDALQRELTEGNYRAVTVPYARAAGERPGCKVVLYQSGKCVAQGKGAAEWVSFVLEPNILGAAQIDDANAVSAEAFVPHMGIDESGKGDFFGPLVIAAAYVDAPLVRELKKLNVRDSKLISSDRKALEIGRALRQILRGRHTVIPIGPRAYNRLYASMRSVNRMLAWGHARAIENLLDRVPSCVQAVADQFGPEAQIKRALMEKGRSIELIQRHKAESDPAVAAASILARCGFLEALQAMAETHGMEIPKGASDRVRAAAVALVRKAGPGVLLDVAKCHFRTADQVLETAGHRREELGPEGQAVSQSARPPAS